MLAVGVWLVCLAADEEFRLYHPLFLQIQSPDNPAAHCYFFLLIRQPQSSTHLPYSPLFRSVCVMCVCVCVCVCVCITEVGYLSNRTRLVLYDLCTVITSGHNQGAAAKAGISS